ncbi:MAG: ABC transporter substrate-binding protein [Marinobacterium sp.]|nr:ABC transporter substrate-binding protein [Marinobacterium sp.]
MTLRQTIAAAVLAASLIHTSHVLATERIISADSALTEIVYALGEGQRLVGVDTTSHYPPEAARLPQIGYKRALAVEGMLSLSPTQVLASQDSGPPIVLEQIRGAGVPVLITSAEPELAAVQGKIEKIAQLLGREAVGARLWQQVQADIDRVKARTAQVKKPLKVLFILSNSGHGLMVGGAGTGADTMLKLAGAENAGAGVKGYKIMTPEAIIAAQPEMVVVMQGGRSEMSADEVFADTALALTPAAKERRFLAIGGAYMLGFGPRIGQALADLNQAFYPSELSSATTQ